MKTIAIANQKGGVGKTTTALNFGAQIYAETGKKPLLIDLDAQGNLTLASQIDLDNVRKTVLDLMQGEDFENVGIEREKFDIIPACRVLMGADLAFGGKRGRESLLKKALKYLASYGYEYIILDCPPDLKLLTDNALAAADHVLVSTECTYFSLAGLNLLETAIDEIREGFNPALSICGVLPIKYRKQRSLDRDVLQELRKKFGKLVFESRIRENVALSEAPSHGKDIFGYAPASAGAEDYKNAVKEFLKRMA